MKLTEDDLKRIKDYFATQEDVVVVYLYGSFAKGATHKGSDIDFGVLFDKPIQDFKQISEIINGLSKLTLPAEPDVRDIDLRTAPVYLRNVIHGQIVFCRDEKKRVNFEIGVMRMIEDTQTLRTTRDYYVKKSLKEGTYGHRLLNH